MCGGSLRAIPKKIATLPLVGQDSEECSSAALRSIRPTTNKRRGDAVLIFERRGKGSCKRCGRFSIRSAAIAPPALLKGANSAQEIDFAEGRPQHIGKIEFAVRALPQQEAGEADLTARANDQIGVGQTGGVKMTGDCFGAYFIDRLCQGRLPRSHTSQQVTH